MKCRNQLPQFYTFCVPVGALLPVPSFQSNDSQSQCRCWSEWAVVRTSQYLILFCSYTFYCWSDAQQSDGSSDFIGSCCDSRNARLRLSPEPSHAVGRMMAQIEVEFWMSRNFCRHLFASVLTISQQFAAVRHQGDLPSTHFHQERISPCFSHPKSGLKPNLRKSLVISQKHQAWNSRSEYQREEAAGSFVTELCVGPWRWPLAKESQFSVETHRNIASKTFWCSHIFMWSSLHLPCRTHLQAYLPLLSCQGNPSVTEGKFQYSFSSQQWNHRLQRDMRKLKTAVYMNMGHSKKACLLLHCECVDPHYIWGIQGVLPM